MPLRWRTRWRRTQPVAASFGRVGWKKPSRSETRFTPTAQIGECRIAAALLSRWSNRRRYLVRVLMLRTALGHDRSVEAIDAAIEASSHRIALVHAFPPDGSSFVSSGSAQLDNRFGGLARSR